MKTSLILMLIWTPLLISTNLYSNSDELFKGLVEARKRIESLRKERAELVEERNNLLDSYEGSLEKAIELEDKIDQLADEILYWMNKYESLSKHCEKEGIKLIPYALIGGSHKHIRGGLGLSLQLGKSFSVYCETYGKYSQWDNKSENGLYYEAGIKYELK